MDELEYEKARPLATITINRPDRKNAFTLPMIDAWAVALRDAAADPSVRAVVLTGAGDAFCSGVEVLGTVGRHCPVAVGLDE
jgi:enoyl-CoA hydratase/carnithine racemase